MGVVYETQHVRLPRRFAVKILAKPVDSDTTITTLARFRREAEIASTLAHPHIVEVFDYQVAESGAPYLVMELLEGEDLADRLKRGRVGIVAALRIIAEIAEALDVAHTGGVVHRDLKPANIFLCKRGPREDFVKVLDFGVSKLIDSATLTQEKAMVGTPLVHVARAGDRHAGADAGERHLLARRDLVGDADGAARVRRVVDPVDPVPDRARRDAQARGQGAGAVGAGGRGVRARAGEEEGRPLPARDAVRRGPAHRARARGAGRSRRRAPSPSTATGWRRWRWRPSRRRTSSAPARWSTAPTRPSSTRRRRRRRRWRRSRRWRRRARRRPRRARRWPRRRR